MPGRCRIQADGAGGTPLQDGRGGDSGDRQCEDDDARVGVRGAPELTADEAGSEREEELSLIHI